MGSASSIVKEKLAEARLSSGRSKSMSRKEQRALDTSTKEIAAVRSTGTDGVKDMASRSSREKKRRSVPKIQLTDGVVQDYINLEKAIWKLEKKNVLKKYEEKTRFADDIKRTLDQLEATFKELKKQTDKERADVENIEQPSVKSFLKQQGIWDERASKEKQDYVEALNKQEIALKEVKGARTQYDRATRVAELYKKQADELNALHAKQHELLAGIFGQDYASEAENKLEAELDDSVEWQQRVSLAKFKWTNGRVLLVHANTQMAFGCTRWKELEEIDASNTRMRYFAAAEARNNFIAASQNVQSCRVYLGKVQFPYATEDDMAKLEETVGRAFKDAQTNSTLKSSLQVYQKTHKQISALIQWFDKVINDTILKDLEKANQKVTDKQEALRKERLELMRKKVKDELGRDLHIEYDNSTEPDTDEELLALEADSERDQLSGLDGQDLHNILNLSQPEGRDPTPVPLDKLAPIPSQDALFGDVQQKLKDYDDTRRAFADRNNAQREKQNVLLQEKLKMRGQKKRRTLAQRRMSTIVPTGADAFQK